MASDPFTYHHWREDDPLLTVVPGSVLLIQVNEEAGASNLLQHLAKSKPHTVSFADPNSEKWHDAFDAFCLDLNSEGDNADEEDVVLTIWNDGTPIEEVAENFVSSLSHMRSDTGQSIVIEIGSGTLIETVKRFQSMRSVVP